MIKAANTNLVTTFSPDRKYRYLLVRDLSFMGRAVDTGTELRTVTFCMLNPSTANEGGDDPTVRRCIGFAKRWGYDRLVVVNLSPLRSTDPNGLLTHGELPVVARHSNMMAIGLASGASEMFVMAYGAHVDKTGPQGQETLDMIVEKMSGLSIKTGRQFLKCLGTTAEGHPRHPLYVPYDKTLEDFEPALRP